MITRVFSYVHNDHSATHKGGCVAEFSCGTDFAGETDEFKQWCSKATMLLYGFGSYELAAENTTIDIERQKLEEILNEKVLLREFHIIKGLTGL